MNCQLDNSITGRCPGGVHLTHLVFECLFYFVFVFVVCLFLSSNHADNWRVIDIVMSYLFNQTLVVGSLSHPSPFTSSLEKNWNLLSPTSGWHHGGYAQNFFQLQSIASPGKVHCEHWLYTFTGIAPTEFSHYRMRALRVTRMRL